MDRSPERPGKLEVKATIAAAQPWLEAGANILWYVTFPKRASDRLTTWKRWLDEIGSLREAFSQGSLSLGARAPTNIFESGPTAATCSPTVCRTGNAL